MPEPRPEVDAYLALGANLGDAALTLRAALVALGGLVQTQVLKASSLYRSAPLGTRTPHGLVSASGPDYVNAVAAVRTQLTAPALLAALLQVEQEFGRVRSMSERYAPRTLDLDLLLYGSGQVHSPMLTVPHPRMTERAFVLVPLAEVAPNLVLPGHGPVALLAAAAARNQTLERLTAPR